MLIEQSPVDRIQNILRQSELVKLKMNIVASGRDSTPPEVRK